MDSVLLSRRDIAFLLYEWLHVDALVTRERFAEHSHETFDGALDLAERVATEQFAPHNKTADRDEPRFVDGRVDMIPDVRAALDVFAKTGLLGSAMDASVGGLQLPAVVANACFTWFQAGNIATSAYAFLTVGAANLLSAHGSPEQVASYVEPMVAGRFFGTMALSEPQAGSSLGDIRTRAEAQQDGTYRLYGSKMWISGGDHELTENIVHLVLAKIAGGPPGVKGISLFVVPKVLLDSGERNDVVLAGLNHKLGYRGTTNTLLNLGEGGHLPGGSAGAVGYLVGEQHQGLSYMFTMMNESRVGVGAGAAALGCTGYLRSLAYARTRPQGRPVSDKDPESAPVPIIEHTDVRRMLLAQKAYTEGALALVLYCARLVDEERTAETPAGRERAHLLLDTLTPIAKSWPSQWCLEANSLAIQVLGGYGYTREYDVEQLWRDNRLNMIHEGTHGIQGLDLLGRKVIQHDGAGLRLLVETVHATTARATGDARPYADQLDTTIDRLAAATQRVWSTGDPSIALANSSTYLECAGHIVVAWLWLEQLLAAGVQSGTFYDGKRQAARYFFRCELPRTSAQLDLLVSLDTTSRDMQSAWF